MPLFVVRHTHDANRCPARHPAMGTMLLEHLGHENAARNGITIHSKAMADGMHTIFMIVEGAAHDAVVTFMAPFAQMGPVEVLPATSCEDVVARGYD
jgi:hypothetical protein